MGVGKRDTPYRGHVEKHRVRGRVKTMRKTKPRESLAELAMEKLISR